MVLRPSLHTSGRAPGSSLMRRDRVRRNNGATSEMTQTCHNTGYRCLWCSDTEITESIESRVHHSDAEEAVVDALATWFDCWDDPTVLTVSLVDNGDSYTVSVKGLSPEKPWSEKSTEHLRGPRGTYDIRDRPIAGLILSELEASDGITSPGLAEILNAEPKTVYSSLRRWEDEYSAVQRFVTSSKTYYQITGVGERILAKYRSRWNRGKRNLPDGFLEGFSESEI